MIDLIIWGAQIPFYIYCWRRVFKWIAYYYVVKPRPIGKGETIQQFSPDWGDVGLGIVGASVASLLWPLILSIAIVMLIMAHTEPIVVAEKLGGKAPPEVRKALLEYKVQQLEAEHGMDVVEILP